MTWQEWATRTDRRHILALSGGKDSSALAVYLRDKVPNLEYVFCDTQKELSETYEYIDKLEAFLRIKIHRLHYEEKQGFDDILQMKRGFLPSPNSRWCTEYLKLKPYEKFIGNANVVSYVGIRADEPHRQGYLSGKPGVKTVFPFLEDGLVKTDIYRILENCGLGLPSYYQWRSRSGCYFCFFQQRREWVGLLERHPDLFEKAQAYEKIDPDTNEHFTWVAGESLAELRQPERIAAIKKEYEERMQRNAQKFIGNQRLCDMWDTEEEGQDLACLICHI
jgi:hypothetical protein